jgi:hypothetical protein
LPRSRALLTAVAIAAASLLAAPAGAGAAPDREVTVMSRNLYLGADIIKAAGAPTPEAQAQAATALWHTGADELPGARDRARRRDPARAA